MGKYAGISQIGELRFLWLIQASILLTCKGLGHHLTASDSVPVVLLPVAGYGHAGREERQVPDKREEDGETWTARTHQVIQ